jgi:hypothetical protein
MCKFYTDGATIAMQHRLRLYPQLTAIAVDAPQLWERATRHHCQMIQESRQRASATVCRVHRILMLWLAHAAPYGIGNLVSGLGDSGSSMNQPDPQHPEGSVVREVLCRRP